MIDPHAGHTRFDRQATHWKHNGALTEPTRHAGCAVAEHPKSIQITLACAPRAVPRQTHGAVARAHAGRTWQYPATRQTMRNTRAMACQGP
eukprot:4102812-Prymnesium_polylepis.1